MTKLQIKNTIKRNGSEALKEVLNNMESVKYIHIAEYIETHKELFISEGERLGLTHLVSPKRTHCIEL